MDRRHFLAGGATVAAGAALTAGPFQGVLAHTERVERASSGGVSVRGRGYGPLRPVRDVRDGEVRLHLPEGFRYRSFNPAGSELGDGTVTPGKHDGMAAFRGGRGSVILVRNHEVNGPVGAFGDLAKAYDSAAGGGTCTLRVTPYGDVLDSRVSLGGTQMNCSGGPMPWGSWVTCEETVNGPDVGETKRLIAIVHPDNLPSQRVAEKIGLSHERDTTSRTGDPVRIYATSLVTRGT